MTKLDATKRLQELLAGQRAAVEAIRKLQDEQHDQREEIGRILRDTFDWQASNQEGSRWEYAQRIVSVVRGVLDELAGPEGPS